MIVLKERWNIIMICTNCGCKLEIGAKFCSHCGKETPLVKDDNVGKITIIRAKQIFGWAIPFEVYIDEVKLGVLKNNTTLTAPISLSEHEIKFTSTEKDVIQRIALDTNKKDVTIYIIPKMGLIAAKPAIKEIKYN